MTRRRVIANGLEYDFAPDDAPLLAWRDWAIATAQVVDDIAGTPLTVPFRVRVVLPGARDEISQDGVRIHHVEGGITVTLGRDGTFALVARPWVRFTPFGVPTTLTVAIEADRFAPLAVTFPIAYDRRTVAVGPTLVGDQVVTLNSNAGLRTGQTLLFGPVALSQYVSVRALGAGGQVTLDRGLLTVQNVLDPVFPDVFTSPPPVVVALRHLPVTISGRVVRRDTSANVSSAVVNASVTVTDFWRTRAAVVSSPANGAMTDPTPALREFAVSITPGALARRAAGATADTLLLGSALDDRTLAGPAAAAEQAVAVDRRQNLLPLPGPVANRLLRIDAGDPSAAEYHTVATVQPPGAAADPARLGLELPLVFSHRDGVRVERINPGALPAPPLSLALVGSTEAGDRCLFFDAPAAAPPPTGLRIAGGGAVDEFQRYSPLSAVTDGDGYFRLPPVQRMARVSLTVDDGLGNVLPPIEIDPDYGEGEHRVDAVYFV